MQEGGDRGKAPNKTGTQPKRRSTKSPVKRYRQTPKTSAGLVSAGGKHAAQKASGVKTSGWSVDGNDLRWSRSGVAFRVQFGTEAGERRAYFTEAGPGTICDLTLAGPDQLFISATSETPPNP